MQTVFVVASRCLWYTVLVVMNYLAFDIEAANGYNPASICSVGIVVADEQFNILRKQNLWINPKSKYNLNGTRPNVGIDLHLDQALIERSPDFSQRYDEICALLTDKDTIVLGHAVDSDVRMLNAACKKYKLPCINFRFVCSQLLYKCFKDDKNVMGLDKIATELGLQFQQHFSDEDAMMSLFTLQYLCNETGLDVEGLLSKYNVRWGENKNFEIVRPVTLTGQISKKKITQTAVENIRKYISSLKKVKQGRNTALKNRVVAISRDIEIADEQVWKPVVEKIVLGGGEYTSKIGKCDLYISTQNTSDSSLTREKYLDVRVANGEKIEVVDRQTFLCD